MKRFSKTKLGLIVIAGLAVLMVMTSAPAAPQGGGAVTGNVTITSPGTGIPLTGACKPTTYTFSSVVLDGLIVNGNKFYVGPITTANVKGGSPCENANGGSGTVNSVAAPASFSGSFGGRSVSGKFYGTFKRTSSLVMVKLTVVQAKLNGASIPNFPVRLDVSLFVPTQLSAAGIKKATFAGEFHLGTV